MDNAQLKKIILEEFKKVKDNSLKNDDRQPLDEDTNESDSPHRDPKPDLDPDKLAALNALSAAIETGRVDRKERAERIATARKAVKKNPSILATLKSIIGMN